MASECVDVHLVVDIGERIRRKRWSSAHGFLLERNGARGAALFWLARALCTTRRRMMANVIAHERYGGTAKALYRVTNGGKNVARGTTGLVCEHKASTPASPLTTFLQDAFLPEGYPASVSPDYLEYQMWDTAQAFASYTCGVLSTHAVLTGMGVGEAEASALAATSQWILKDGMGMVGRIGFAWYFASRLDSNAKTYRLVADVANDAAMVFELVSPLFPREAFVLFVCAGSLVRAVTAVAGGATRAAITVHQARQHNVSDVAAKDGSQETAVNLVGMLVGYFLITPFVAGGNAMLVWPVFLLFVLLHLYSNYRAVSCVAMTTLNRQRAALLVDQFLEEQMMTPEQLVHKESIFYWGDGTESIRLGVRFGELSARGDDLVALLAHYDGLEYVLEAEDFGRSVRVVLGEYCRNLDITRAFVHAYLLRKALASPVLPPPAPLDSESEADDGGESDEEDEEAEDESIEYEEVDGYESDDVEDLLEGIDLVPVTPSRRGVATAGFLAGDGGADPESYLREHQRAWREVLNVTNGVEAAVLEFMDLYFEEVFVPQLEARGWDLAKSSFAAGEWRVLWRKAM